MHQYAAASASDPYCHLRITPWFTHAWKLRIPRTATWEDLPALGDVDGFQAAVWTGSEMVFFGGGNSQKTVLDGTTAVYTPIGLPGQ